MSLHISGRKLLNVVMMFCLVTSAQSTIAANKQLPPVVCPHNPIIPAEIERGEVYKDFPFMAGEEARYKLMYGFARIFVGYGFLRVQHPMKQSIVVGTDDGKEIIEKRNHMVFQSEAYTGEWYKLIFAGHDKVQAINRPWDFGISKFYISQNEEKPLVRRYRKEKWLDFNHFNCKVYTKELDHTKPAGKNHKEGDYELEYGAADSLGAVFKLRTYDFKLGEPVRFLVHSSEKNWWLEATPQAFEKVKVDAGTFDTVRIKLTTYIGKELTQKGDIQIWIATKHPNRPLIKVEGSVSFGRIYLHLERYRPGST